MHERERERERERDLPEETVNCSPAWDCGKGSLVLILHGSLTISMKGTFVQSSNDWHAQPSIPVVIHLWSALMLQVMFPI